MRPLGKHRPPAAESTTAIGPTSADHVAADRAVAPLPQSQAPSPASAWGADTGGRQIDAAQLIGIIEAIRKSRVRLSASSREFLNGLECRAVAYPSVNLSEKQHQWLHDLAQAAAAKVPS